MRGDDDRVEVIPRQIRDARYVVRGDVNSGVANLRVQVWLDSPGYVLALDGKELAAKIATKIQAELSRRFARGLDAQGRPLPALSPKTVKRREQRRRQREDNSGALRDRFRLRGRGQPGKPTSYQSTDPSTPFHESGLAAQNVAVRFKGTESGDPVYLLALPSGGKSRGLVNDDGRGARLFAAKHYGFQRLMDVPYDLEPEIDRLVAQHLDAAVAAGLGADVIRLIQGIGSRVSQTIEQATDEDL